jgi:hypothetical protein
MHMTREAQVPITSGAVSDPGGAPALSGQQRLRVDPVSIVGAKKAFQEALDGIHAQLRRIRAAGVEPWAADPVSSETAAAFNNRTSGDEPAAAERVLVAYANQLTNAIDSLQHAEDAYRRTEGENSALWGQHTVRA